MANSAETILQHANALTNLAKLSQNLAALGGGDDYANEYEANLLEARAETSKLIAFLTRNIQIVQAYEDEQAGDLRARAAAARNRPIQVTLPYPPKGTTVVVTAEAGQPAKPEPYPAERFELWTHKDSHEAFAVAMEYADDGTELQARAYHELPKGGDLPALETLPFLSYETGSVVLDYLNNDLEPWGLEGAYGTMPPPPEPEGKPKRGRPKKAK